MKDWKAAVRTWEKSGNTSNNTKQSAPVPTWFNKKYDDEELGEKEKEELESILKGI